MISLTLIIYILIWTMIMNLFLCKNRMNSIRFLRDWQRLSKVKCWVSVAKCGVNLFLRLKVWIKRFIRVLLHMPKWVGQIHPIRILIVSVTRWIHLSGIGKSWVFNWVSGSNIKVGLCLNVDDAVIWLVGARFVRPKTVCLVYYFQGCDRWFGQVNLAPTVEVW